ncbi:MAG: Rpn family recombination-promoting nuclease/putative transposase, partial [Spirochaetes bacterium]|nr:Rpn family recombination-promoting nuclease/putative transposase [Spirochaetota bacterium]MBN2771980.1 Rpn family recombination-promoting nuclease/putative transposase [Spirochaetota bacterium]
MNEHDKLFKAIESVKENATDLIRSVFPKEIINEIDYDSLQLDNNSYVDKNLKEHYTDLVYRCKRKDHHFVTVSLLFEHKSFKPKNEYLQLLRYMVNIWSYQEKNRENLTLIVPIIFYHGKKRWKIAPLKDLINGCDEKWAQFVPDFRYLLTDVARYDDKTIKTKLYKREFNRALALIFKYISNESLLSEKLYDIMFQLKDYLDNEKDIQLIMSFLK